MSGLRSSPGIRAKRLAGKIRRREPQERRTGLSAREIAWERALELAPSEELRLLCGLSQTQEPESSAILETMLKMWELRERIMHRSAPSLATIFRTKRCLFWRALRVLAERTEAAHDEGFTTGYASADETVAAWRWLEQRDNGLSTARINREHAIRSGAEPVKAPAEAKRLVEEVLEAVGATDTDRVFRLVGRI